MSDPAVVRRYASALFDVAAARQRLAIVGRDLASVVDLVRDHADLAAMFGAPLVAPRKKRALVEALLGAAGSTVAPEVQRLLLFLADRDRLGLLDAIATAFHARVMEADRQAEATVVSAVPLTPDGEAALATALGVVTGRHVTIRSTVDPGLVGGLVARVGSLVMDASVVRQLELMRERLLGDA